MIRSLWKPFYISKNLYNLKYFFFKKNNNIEQKNIIFASRNSIILKQFVSKTFKIHNGLKMKIIIIKPFMIGHKFGEFFMTRKRAIFKPKLKKK